VRHEVRNYDYPRRIAVRRQRVTTIRGSLVDESEILYQMSTEFAPDHATLIQRQIFGP
jgi:hypothetical protein